MGEQFKILAILSLVSVAKIYCKTFPLILVLLRPPHHTAHTQKARNCHRRKPPQWHKDKNWSFQSFPICISWENFLSRTTKFSLKLKSRYLTSSASAQWQQEDDTCRRLPGNSLKWSICIEQKYSKWSGINKKKDDIVVLILTNIFTNISMIHVCFILSFFYAVSYISLWISHAQCQHIHYSR